MAAHLTVADLAERWQRSPQWVQRNAKHIPGSWKNGGLWRFDLADIERYEARRKTPDPLSMTPMSAQRQMGKAS